MILRRISQGIRQQDWFVVIVEVMIVVVGIFIGLQVDDWNEARLERAHEKVVLERVFEESQEIISYFVQQTERRIISIERIENGVVALQSALEGAAYSYESLSDLNRVSFFPAITPPRAVFDELSTSGDVSIISNDEVRRAITGYLRQLAFLESQLPAFRRSAMDTPEKLNAGLIPVYDPTLYTRRDIRVDLGRMLHSRDVLPLFTLGLRNQIVFTSYVKEALKAAYAMCQSIAKKRELTCPEIDATLTRYETMIGLSEAR